MRLVLPLPQSLYDCPPPTFMPCEVRLVLPLPLNTVDEKAMNV